MDSDNTLVSLETQIENLENEKIHLEQQELYSDVENLTKKIAALKVKLKKQQLDMLKLSHLDEKETMEKNYQNESKNFNSNWDNIIEAYLEKCSAEVQEFHKKHQEDILNEKNRLENTLHMFFKPSPALLNMIKCKEKAVKVGKYSEAQNLFDQIEELKTFEESKFAELKKSAVDQGLANFEQGYQKKLQNLKKRHQSGLNELEVQRIQENEVLIKKYENLKREMENVHQIRQNIYEGKHTTAAGRHHQSPNKTFYSTSSSSPSSVKKNS